MVMGFEDDSTEGKDFDFQQAVHRY